MDLQEFRIWLSCFVRLRVLVMCTRLCGYTEF